MIKNKKSDNFFIGGKRELLVSIPHHVNQTRLWSPKKAEPDSFYAGFIFDNETHSLFFKKQKTIMMTQTSMKTVYTKKIKKDHIRQKYKILTRFS